MTTHTNDHTDTKDPCKVKKQIRQYLNAKEYVNEFYQVPVKVAESLLKRETLRIPIFSKS